MEKLKVGIIGTGMAFEHLHLPAYQRLTDRYQIVALCDVDTWKARDWANRLNIGQEHVYSRHEDMLQNEDLDVVDIMVPIELNYVVTESVAKALAGKGKGIIAEKPLAPNMAEAYRARDLTQKYNIPIMIAENYRYNQEINILRDLVRTKRVGDIIYFIQNRPVEFPIKMYQNSFYARQWRQHPEFPGGNLTDAGLHDISRRTPCRHNQCFSQRWQT